MILQVFLAVIVLTIDGSIMDDSRAVKTAVLTIYGQTKLSYMTLSEGKNLTANLLYHTSANFKFQLIFNFRETDTDLVTT